MSNFKIRFVKPVGNEYESSCNIIPIGHGFSSDIFVKHDDVINNLYHDEFDNLKRDLCDDVSRAELEKYKFTIQRLFGVYNTNYIYVDIYAFVKNIREMFPILANYYGECRERSEFASIYAKYKDILNLGHHKFDTLMSGYVFLPDSVRFNIKDKVAFDFGSFDGHGALLYSEVFAKTYAFEPVLEQYENTRVFLENFGNHDRVEAVNLGIGDVESNIEFINLLEGASQIATPEVIALYPNVERKIVRVTTIDNFVKENNISSVGLMKFDVEGYEYNAIQGGLETIKRDKPVMLISVYHTFKDLFEIKDVINNLGLGYKFMFRHLLSDYDVTDDAKAFLFNEFMLICWCE